MFILVFFIPMFFWYFSLPFSSDYVNGCIWTESFLVWYILVYVGEYYAQMPPATVSENNNNMIVYLFIFILLHSTFQELEVSGKSK